MSCYIRKNHRVLISLLAILIAGPAGAETLAATGGPSDQLLEEANQLLERGRYERAIEVFQQVDRAENGTSATALVGLAIAANGLDDFDAAMTYAQRGIELAPPLDLRAVANGELAYAIASSDLYRLDELEQAIEEVRRHLVDHPDWTFSDRLRVRLCAARREVGWRYSRGSEPLVPDTTDSSFVKPRKIEAPQPAPPPFARGRKNQRAVAQVVIDQDGCLVDVEIEKSSNRRWAEAATATYTNWVFEPARLDGEPVAIFYTLTSTLQYGGR